MSIDNTTLSTDNIILSVDNNILSIENIDIVCCFRSTLGEFPNGNSLFLGEIKHVSFLYQYFIRLSALIVLKEETGLIRASQNLVLMRGIFNKTLLNTRGYCF